MRQLMNQLLNDEAGFIVSAELVLVSTIAVLAMVVGLSELANNVNQELEDVGSAFSCIDQSYSFTLSHGHKGRVRGSSFKDHSEFCEGQFDIKRTKSRGEK
ncbi:MAG: branched-chain amino acid aminotransferase [Planctomycetes bacterium]|nr:branched-chain amino acid aminotransferase [Planctomycetota bacterium]